MSLPKLKKRERSSDFIARGMSSTTMKKEFPDTKQRLAVLYNILRESRGDSKVPEPEKEARAYSYRDKYSMFANIPENIRRQYPQAIPQPFGVVNVGGNIIGYYLPLDSRLLYMTLVAPAIRIAELLQP